MSGIADAFQPVPKAATEAVMVASSAIPDEAVKVAGYEFNQGVDYDQLFASFGTTGFQACHFSDAVRIINKMRAWRLSDEPIKEDDYDEFADPEFRKNYRAKVYLAYTSNMISSGVRETIRFLVEHKMVDVIVSSAGGVEEDIIKTFAHMYLGRFQMDDRQLRREGLNRLGNLIVPNDNYVKFEEWVNPILDKMVDEQKATGVVWTPSSMIRRLGLELNDDSSVLTWAARNDIPIFCPALTDGSLGDMIYFHNYRKPGLVVDLVGDIRKINDSTVYARKTGMIVIGGGVVKHHTLNANLMRNGADWAVFLNTAQEFDGSDAGARPEEALSWGKVRLDADYVKIVGDASFFFPLLVSQTFAKDFKKKADEENTEKKAPPAPGAAVPGVHASPRRAGPDE
ncbi:deoxyhypusine synthase [Fonticula alba]|uniref:deoxyhypusine synthase n=1 Tax=Fonticula alba TaxID=691883 RepID=A0A058ZEJ5_FONAL|nr:deoxyhypusine synthase [Fonticula alba]KCV72371.1 deoxyhypusine synthase [Fonticula alba]|eukprot:XP_009493949.1 deoxyhypusine synthase [Fonticula alba]